MGADILSRQGPRPGEWRLHPEVVKQAWRVWPGSGGSVCDSRDMALSPLVLSDRFRVRLCFIDLCQRLDSCVWFLYLRLRLIFLLGFWLSNKPHLAVFTSLSLHVFELFSGLISVRHSNRFQTGTCYFFRWIYSLNQNMKIRCSAYSRGGLTENQIEMSNSRKKYNTLQN